MMAYLEYLQSLIGTPRLLNFTTRKHVPTLATATLSCFIASFTVPLFSIILGDVFNDFALLGSGDITGDALIPRVSRQCLQFLALGVLGWFFNGIYYTLFVVFGELQAANARSKLFDNLLKKEQRFFEEHEEGERTFLGCLQMCVPSIHPFFRTDAITVRCRNSKQQHQTLWRLYCSTFFAFSCLSAYHFILRGTLLS